MNNRRFVLALAIGIGVLALVAAGSRDYLATSQSPERPLTLRGVPSPTSPTGYQLIPATGASVRVEERAARAAAEGAPVRQAALVYLKETADRSPDRGGFIPDLDAVRQQGRPVWILVIDERPSRWEGPRAVATLISRPQPLLDG